MNKDGIGLDRASYDDRSDLLSGSVEDDSDLERRP